MTWLITGNSNATTTSFLGTTNPQPLVIKTNDKEAMRVASADGDVSIGELGGTRDLDYKLDVQGILNADDIYKGGTQLVGSQWKDVTGNGINYGGGRVGIGTTTPNARLSVVGPGAAEIRGTARSSTLLSSAGRLGATAGDELALASIGFATVNNNVSLGIRGYRAADGPDWPTTAIGLGMDVDNTVRAGASFWLHANGNVGIGSTAPAVAYKLDVAGVVNAADYHKNGTPLISAGRTPPGQGWQQYPNDTGDAGVFIDVNTTPHRFATTPVYVTALHGISHHWDTTGGSSVYTPTPTGFRVYIKWSSGRPLTVSEAQNHGWHIQWIGIETTG